MMLIERGEVRLSDPVVKFIPEMKGEGRDAITIEQLLTHTAGFAPDFDLKERWIGYDEAMKRLYREPLRNAPGTRFVYSDINYITLGEVVHRLSGTKCSMSLRAEISLFRWHARHRLSARRRINWPHCANRKTAWPE